MANRRIAIKIPDHQFTTCLQSRANFVQSSSLSPLILFIMNTLRIAAARKLSAISTSPARIVSEPPTPCPRKMAIGKETSKSKYYYNISTYSIYTLFSSSIQFWIHGQSQFCFGVTHFSALYSAARHSSGIGILKAFILI